MSLSYSAMCSARAGSPGAWEGRCCAFLHYSNATNHSLTSHINLIPISPCITYVHLSHVFVSSVQPLLTFISTIPQPLCQCLTSDLGSLHVKRFVFRSRHRPKHEHTENLSQTLHVLYMPIHWGGLRHGVSGICGAVGKGLLIRCSHSMTSKLWTTRYKQV